MIICCSRCEEFIGICEPITNWKTDRTATCAKCLQKQLGTATTDFLSNCEADMFPEDSEKDVTPPRESFRKWRG
jgi:hypothetical protein